MDDTQDKEMTLEEWEAVMDVLEENRVQGPIVCYGVKPPKEIRGLRLIRGGLYGK